MEEKEQPVIEINLETQQKSIKYDEKQFVVTPALYMEDNVYYFEINASEFAGYERYQVNVSPYTYYISEEYMFEALNEKYNLPEGIITNSPSVYIHYSGPGILYIRMK